MNTTIEYNEAHGAGPARRAPRPRALSMAVALLLVLAALCVAATLLAVLAAPLVAQRPVRLWAAQTGPDQVSLTWDSIPGTNEYLIYGLPVDSVVGNLRMRPPLQRLSARSRSSTLFGIRRLSAGITLVAMAANGHVIQKAQFNPVTPATSFATVQPPEEVTAAVTGPTEITLSWTPVPGATAYYIGRAIAPGGLGTICMVCSAEPRYVDQDVVPGARTRYAVAAIFPNGKSQSAPSNDVTPGVTQVATTSSTAPTMYSKSTPGTLTSTTPSTTGSTTTTGTSTTPSTTGDTTVTYSTASSYDAAHGTVTTVTTRTVCTVATPQRCWSTTTTTTSAYTPPSSGTTTTASTSGTPTTPTATPSTTTTTSATPAAAPDTATATPTGGIAGVINTVEGVVGTITGAVSPPAAVSAVSPAPASVRLTWQASPTAEITAYHVNRRVNGGPWQLVTTVGASTLSYSDTFFPVTMFASGAAWVSYGVVAVKSNMSSSSAVTGTLSVNPPPATTATAPATSTTVGGCKLDYQRADNMWAAAGRPDGQLGTETLSLAPGQDKVFITDWTYEKQRNDGTNYYGSHLRIATNSSTRVLRLQIRLLASTSWVQLDPGKTQQFQVDLMEVFCPN